MENRARPPRPPTPRPATRVICSYVRPSCSSRHGVHGAQSRVFTAAALRTCMPDPCPISAFPQYDLHTCTLYTHVYRLHGPREPQHHDLVSTKARKVDLVTVHQDCGNLTFRLEAYTLQDVA